MWDNILVGQVCFWDMAHQAGAYPSFSNMKKEYFFSSLDGMLVHQGVTPSFKFVGIRGEGGPPLDLPLVGTHLFHTPGWRKAL